MAAKLSAVEIALRAQFVALGSPGGSFDDWCGIGQPHKEMHLGQHTNGGEIHRNFDWNPYVATRIPRPPGLDMAVWRRVFPDSR
jgi:hypothetical protein